MPNTAPIFYTPLPDRNLGQGESIAFRVTSNAADPESQPLAFSASLVGGGPLPAWVAFDAASGRFEVSAPNDFLGKLAIRVTASDGELSASDDFQLTVLKPNLPPVVARAIPDRTAMADVLFRFRIPDGTFVDPEGDLIQYSATLENGQPLPYPLLMDNFGVFEGTLGADAVGQYRIVVSAGTGISTAFTLTVGATDAAPVPPVIADQNLAEDTPWQFQLPAFTDSDSAGLVYKAALADRMPLPSWLGFDPVTRTFSGTPPLDFVGDIQLAVTADDGSRDATQSFTLHVANVEDAPRLVIPFRDMDVQEDERFGFGRYPTQNFADPDGDPLTYEITLANGDPLPDWISWFSVNSEKLSIVGRAPANFTGTIPIRITASDGNLSGSGVFNLRVVPVNDAPVLLNPTPSQALLPGATFRFHLPDNTFADVDSPQLTYAATQATGEGLPDWLQFDPATRDFTGTAPADFAGLGVRVTARDEFTTVAETFAFASSAPLLLNPLADQTLARGNPWVFTVPDNTFFDADTPALTYGATLADGSPLPGWIGFNPATRRFSGTPPADWTGHTDIKVTAGDGQSQASDVFAIDELGDISFRLTGSNWGRSAPAEIHYRFDPLYYAIANSWGVGFDEGFSAGPVYGGVSGSISFGYELQAGLLLDFALRPDTFDIEANVRVIQTRSTADQAIGASPWVKVEGALQAGSHFRSTGNPDAFALQAFAGIAAKLGATIKGGIYGGFETPDIDLGPLGSISIPDITFDAGFEKFIGLPEIQKITVADGTVTLPDDGLVGAVEVNVRSGDPAYDLIKILHLDLFDKIGTLNFTPPSGFTFDGYELDGAGSGMGTMHAVAISAPIIEAGLDLDEFVIDLILRTRGVDIRQLFHLNSADFLPDIFPDMNIGGGQGFNIAFMLNSDFALIGDLRLREDMYFTPQVNAVLHTSYGETITGTSGQQINFHTPEGEGEFTVDASYTTQGVLRTELSLVGTLHFDLNLLDPSLDASVGVGPISFSIPIPDLPSVYQDSLRIADFTLPFYTAQDAYDLEQTRHDSFVLGYETFRTPQGSGDSFTLTTHQDSAEGNFNANRITGNTRNNTIDGGSGDDTLDGADGDDRLVGNQGNDQIDGGTGTDTALFFDDREKYSIGLAGGWVGIRGPDGTDTLRNVELLQFGTAAPITIESLRGQPDTHELMSFISGGQLTFALPLDYSGPLDLQNVYPGTENDDVVGGTERNDFVNLGSGNDAAHMGPGDDVIDGGGGSNFLSGDAGHDTFFLDGRFLVPVWSCITDWDLGESLTLWGWTAGVSKAAWSANDGLPGYLGATLFADIDGNGLVETAVTWAGIAIADLPAGREMEVSGIGVLYFN